MAIRVSLPEGFQQSWFPVLQGGSDYSQQKFSLYFSGEVQLLLADFLECSFIQSVKIELCSVSEGILFQVHCLDDLKAEPVELRLEPDGRPENSGFITPGLLSGIWQIRVPGKLPSVPFRLSLRFA